MEEGVVEGWKGGNLNPSEGTFGLSSAALGG